MSYVLGPCFAVLMYHRNCASPSPVLVYRAIFSPRVREQAKGLFLLPLDLGVRSLIPDELPGKVLIASWPYKPSVAYRNGPPELRPLRETAKYAASPVYTEDVDAARLGSHWSKDSTSDIVFASQSLYQDSSYGAPWSYPSTWAYETAGISSDSDEEHMDFFERRMRTPDLTESPASSLPTTPNSLDTSFDCKIAKPEPRSGLMINTNIPRPRIYEANTSITSFSPSTSIMHTAIEEPYNVLFSASPVSPGKRVFMSDSAITAVDDEEMTSPSLWSSTSATEMSSPSSYSDSSATSSFHGEDFFQRSSTPSPEPEPLALWAQYQLQVQSPPQQCQLSSSVSTSITDVLPHSRLSNSLFGSKRHSDPVSASPRTPTPARGVSPSTSSSSVTGKSSTLSRFAIKFFPRSASPSPAPASPAAAVPHGRAPAEPPRPSTARRQAPPPAAESPAWSPQQVVVPAQTRLVFQESDTAASTGHATPVFDKNSHRHLQEQQQHRSPRHWFMPGRFRVSGGVN
ncbi:unnamed protein product [Cyclocybe aegerita]|uniref:Uncharacterized protein n=1 Tax=Cyclocybe aegerita TaxID=1973307 RepID=A0A8S0WBW2_CYCAE|nr:unnamed protein product [Cyclocybe aegerita]